MNFQKWVLAAAMAAACYNLGSAQEPTTTEDKPSQKIGADEDLGDRPNEQEVPSDVSTALNAIEAAIRATESRKNEAEEARTRDQSERNVNAQEAVAHWSALMFYTAVASTAITLFALVALVRTLHHTRRAADSAEAMVKEAKLTTRAALETVETTRRIGDEQLRPYLAYEGVESEVWKTGENRFLELDFAFRNCGVTPAIVTAASCAVYAPRGEPTWSLSVGNWRPLRVFIGPNQIGKLRFQTIKVEPNGTFSSFAVGILVTYRAVRGEKNGPEFEDHVWLIRDHSGFRQDYPGSMFQLYRRPEDDG